LTRSPPPATPTSRSNGRTASACRPSPTAPSAFYQDEAEYGEVIWRFAPQAAEQARGYLFHPDQVMEDNPDGSLTIRFTASGHLEMCWHLYTWGDSVEVVEPEVLRRMVEGYRRGDFPARP
jgi:predicted DNA-binding transcriptional regulator YafY